MDPSLILSNLLTPPVLFFFLGVAAALLKSDLEIPQPVPKFLSLYLLLAIGFKGGVELNRSGASASILLTVAAAIAAALVIPLIAYVILRRKLDVSNAAAVAAAYGSVSAVTFVTASGFLEQVNIASSGYMVAIMALMESPAIILGITLYQRNKPNGSHGHRLDLMHLLRESVLNASVFLLLGSLLIGVWTGERGYKALSPFTGDVFQGFLSLFLLDLGIASAKRLGGLRRFGVFPIAFALLMPIVSAGIGIVLSMLIGLPIGDALIFTVLCASASYIAVPAAMRISIPEADAALYVPMALAITFPLNVSLGIPMYLALINALRG